MSKYAAAVSQHPEAAVATGEILGAISERMDGTRPDFVVAFISMHHFDAVRDITTAIQEILRPRALVGGVFDCVAGGSDPGISIWASSRDDSKVLTLVLETEEPGIIRGWPDDIGSDEKTLILIADPGTFPLDRVLASIDENLPAVTVVGGYASTAKCKLIADSIVASHGAVAALLDAPADACFAAGFRPVGNPFTVTAASVNTIFELGGRPALDRLEEAFANSDEALKQSMSVSMHVGKAVDEETGSYLVRNIVGVQDKAIAIDCAIEIGDAVRFHTRSPDAAEIDAENAASALVFSAVPGAQCAPVGSIAEANCAAVAAPLGGANLLHQYSVSAALFD